MLHIAVCDPNAGHRAALCDALAKLLFDTVDYRFACFAGGEELLAALEGGAACQLVFLEVRLGGALNGLETAGLLRYRAPQADIIFLTRLAEHIGDGYRYHAFDFLIKPVPMARLQETVDRYLEERRQRPADYLKVSIQRRSVQLPLRQILCLESRRRKVVAHMTGDQVVFYGRLDALEKLLAPSGFLRCPELPGEQTVHPPAGQYQPDAGRRCRSARKPPAPESPARPSAAADACCSGCR